MSKIVNNGVLRIISLNLRKPNTIIKSYMYNKTYLTLSHFKKEPYSEKKCYNLYYNNTYFQFNTKHNEKNTTTSNLNLKVDDYKLSEDPDKFGGQYYLSDEVYDEDDIKEANYIKEIPKRDKEKVHYARLIKKHLNKRQVKEALEVLEVKMKEERIQPDKYIFNLLISGCAKAGYARKAYKLFFKMKQCGVKPSESTYTSLFNACANAPSISDGLDKIKRLREIMIENEYQPNRKNYNAMMKAYGRCCDLTSVFLLADEMLDRGLLIDTETFNFLLQACASDKNLGYRHALLTWHKMIQKGVKPDVYSFNTILKCVKDCSIGDVDSMNSVIQDILHTSPQISHLEKNDNILIERANQTNQYSDRTCKELTINSSYDLKSVDSHSLPSTDIIQQKDVPNLLSSTPHLGNLIKINEIQKPEDRLLLVGGFSGFLEVMKIHKVTPEIETFTTLLEVIPSTNSIEKKLISTIRSQGLKTDIDFFNTLIKKRIMRMDYEGAKEVLNMIKTVKLTPDVFTYGILSLTCKTSDEARELLDKMKKNDINMNIQILGAMLNQSCYYKDFNYISEIMQISLDEKIKPNTHFLTHLSKFNQQCARLINIQHSKGKSPAFQNNYKKFKENLHMWYEVNGISGLQLEEQIQKIKEHPYKKFKEKTNDEMIENFNKKKVRRYINKIKLDDLSKNKNNTIVENENKS